MSLQHLITELVEFNCWANGLYLDWLAPQPDEVLAREIQSSCPSIIKTLKHIWEAQEYWYGVVAETEDFVRVWEIEDPTRAMICVGLGSNSQKLAEFVKTVSDDDLSKRLRIDNDWLNCELRKYEYLQQVVHHATYHRGQIVTMAHNLGISGAPATDFLIRATRIDPT
ncbi:MAG: DinB family protein [Acidobacteria bacterium]|nr:DinB family protein [Acidobacteriota bacterium]